MPPEQIHILQDHTRLDATVDNVSSHNRNLLWILISSIIGLCLLGTIIFYFYFFILPEQSTTSASTPDDITIAEQISSRYLYLLSEGGAAFLGTVSHRDGSWTMGSTARVFESPIFDDIDNLYYISTVKAQSDYSTSSRSSALDTNKLIQISDNGTQSNVGIFGDALTQYPPGKVLSSDRAYMAYCMQGRVLEIMRISNQETEEYSVRFCNKGGGMHFSRDGKYILGHHDYYEMFSEFMTDEEYRQMQIEDGIGYYQLNLQTGQQLYLGPDVIVLKDVSSGRELRYTEEQIIVKDVSETTKDVFSKSEYNNLPVVATLSLPDVKIRKAYLTPNGDGIYYFVLHPANRDIRSFGYYDIAQEKNYYPLTIQTTGREPILLPPVNKEGLYYLVTEESSILGLRGFLDKQRLMHLSLQGDVDVVSEKLGAQNTEYVIFIAPETSIPSGADTIVSD